MKRLGAFSLALSWLIAAPAWAYIPPGPYIVAKMAEKRVALTVNDLEALLTTAYPDRGSDDWAEKLQLKRGGKLRWTRTESEGDAVTVLRDGKRTEVSPNGEVKTSPQAFEPLTDLLFPKMGNLEVVRTDMVALMQKLGVDLTTDTLQRVGARVAYVFGAKAGELAKPQVWLDKDTYLPLRIVYKDGDRLWDVSFSEWGAQGGGDVFPRVIKRLLNGKLYSETTVERVSTNQKLADSLFTPPAAKK